MELIENLFVGGNVSDLETIVYSLRREVPVLRLYCIVYLRTKTDWSCFPPMSCFIREIKTALRKLQALPWAERRQWIYFFLWRKKRRRRGEILPIQGS